jgi:hypothetical protein
MQALRESLRAAFVKERENTIGAWQVIFIFIIVIAGFLLFHRKRFEPILYGILFFFFAPLLMDTVSLSLQERQACPTVIQHDRQESANAVAIVFTGGNPRAKLESDYARSSMIASFGSNDVHT